MDLSPSVYSSNAIFLNERHDSKQHLSTVISDRETERVSLGST